MYVVRRNSSQIAMKLSDFWDSTCNISNKLLKQVDRKGWILDAVSRTGFRKGFPTCWHDKTKIKTNQNQIVQDEQNHDDRAITTINGGILSVHSSFPSLLDNDLKDWARTHVERIQLKYYWLYDWNKLWKKLSCTFCKTRNSKKNLKKNFCLLSS